ncbi:reverse transcriptase domain-containing protein [Tanacetum coccineum]|uniref:Reverse transcriptase domain-containing protein n=1 Tax=Tanacetum coccineum TaxID=301880 RepID=A0ABQ5CKD8_9ASTR
MRYSPERSKLQEPWILIHGWIVMRGRVGQGLISLPGRMEIHLSPYALIHSHENNEASYEALIAGLRIAARMGVRNLEANVDSRLVANHVLGEYVAKEDT